MGKPTGRAAKLFEKYDEHIEKDYDPEAENGVASGSEESSDEHAGTEHYVNVGKSKLRERGENSLGPQYRGSKVSRNALEEESSDEDEEDEEDEEGKFDDPETANLEADTAKASDSEIGSDDALAESDNEKLRRFVFRGSSKPKKPRSKRATAADYMSGSGEEDDEELEDEDEDDDEDDESEDDIDDGLEALIDGEADEDDEEEESEEEEEEEEEEEDEEPSKETPASDRRTPNADIEKGAAIQKQRKLYDGLLNLRIRLQKALIAANTFGALKEEQDGDDATAESFDAAEVAAIKLLGTIASLRENCSGPIAAGKKRKRDYEISMPSAQIWDKLQEDGRRSLKFRERTMEKWSRKVQSVNVTAPKGLSSRNKTLVDSLHDQLNNPENRLAKRTRVPRSCAPAQAAKKITDDETIFDDADFYQLLLKELVEQRTVDPSSHQTSAVPSVVLTASRESRTRKVVDRKASKGRKMRFTVHEKLQNFMAPEDRRSWEQHTIDRFFGTLFGRKLELNEEDEPGEDDEDMDDVADVDFKLFA